MHEAQSTCIYRHPNVLPLYTAFVVGKDVWFVQPYISGGSVFNIMRYKFPNVCGCDARLWTMEFCGRDWMKWSSQSS